MDSTMHKTVMTNLSSILGFITIVPYNDLLIFLQYTQLSC